jgi:hypothetical protein
MSILEPRNEEAQADPEVREESLEDSEYEQSDLSAEETEYEEEAVEESPKYRVKANGEELEVSLDELLNGYSRTADYQKKTQSLAEQRKAVEAERGKIEETARVRDTYAQRLKVIEQLLQQQHLLFQCGHQSVEIPHDASQPSTIGLDLQHDFVPNICTQLSLSDSRRLPRTN